MMLTILGIDPSLSASGYFDALRNEAATIKTKPARKDWRLLDIAGQLSDLLRETLTLVPLAVLEDLPISARAAGKTGMAHGVIRKVLLAEGIEYVTLPPATLKKAATGSGRAEKSDMINSYNKAYPDVVITDDNQADAAWLAECGKALLGLPNKLAHPESLDKYRDRVPVSALVAVA